MPTKRKPTITHRVFSRGDEAIIAVFLADRLRSAELALKRAVEFWDREKNSQTTQQLIYRRHVSSTIEWLLNTLRTWRGMKVKDIDRLIELANRRNNNVNDNGVNNAKPDSHKHRRPVPTRS